MRKGDLEKLTQSGQIQHKWDREKPPLPYPASLCKCLAEWGLGDIAKKKKNFNKDHKRSEVVESQDINGYGPKNKYI